MHLPANDFATFYLKDVRNGYACSIAYPNDEVLATQRRCYETEKLASD
ncbi:hypothetical protein [Panacibacter ginsenosidivorans]|nr:hypothetical protein [Panacibacter ginsenosidivorans]